MSKGKMLTEISGTAPKLAARIRSTSTINETPHNSIAVRGRYGSLKCRMIRRMAIAANKTAAKVITPVAMPVETKATESTAGI